MDLISSFFNSELTRRFVAGAVLKRGVSITLFNLDTLGLSFKLMRFDGGR
jgi:hypothetical protein